MTWNTRTAVADALLAAGWADLQEAGAVKLLHPSGALLALFQEDGQCGLKTRGSDAIPFFGTVPDSVVVAACLAASGQIDPARIVDLEGQVTDLTAQIAALETKVAELGERDEWLSWLEAAGLDNWVGVDTAREMRNDAEATR